MTQLKQPVKHSEGVVAAVKEGCRIILCKPRVIALLDQTIIPLDFSQPVTRTTQDVADMMAPRFRRRSLWPFVIQNVLGHQGLECSYATPPSRREPSDSTNPHGDR
jgi:hypothetical protein